VAVEIIFNPLVFSLSLFLLSYLASLQDGKDGHIIMPRMLSCSAKHQRKQKRKMSMMSENTFKSVSMATLF
jgi:hypothetical protein